MKFNLSRFIEAQNGNNGMVTYHEALREIKNGKKTSHWIWYIFPQLRQLGRSSYSDYFGISGLNEAQAYMDNLTLGTNLIEISNALLLHPEKTIVNIVGPVDSLKIHSCVTLFSMTDEPDPVFNQILDLFYNNKPDSKTLDIIKNKRE